MILFEYDGVMKRYNVKVPFTLAGESSMVTVASISEDERITVHRELSLKLMHQIILQWEEKVHMDTMKIAREAGEFDSYFDDDEPKSKELTFLEERLQIPGRGERTDAWKDIRIEMHPETKYLNFSTRTWNALISKGVHTVGELVEKKPSDLFKIKNFGRKSLTEVEQKLLELGLTLKQ